MTLLFLHEERRAGMLQILYLNTDLFQEEHLFQKGMGLLSEERKQKIGQFKTDMPARLSLAAGILFYLALEQKGLSHRLNDIHYGKFGKPYLKEADFHFSLSHSGKYAVCVWSDGPVGADLQKVKEKLPAHTAKILSEAERRYLEGLSETEKRETFFRFWAMKEAVSKWDGRGLRLPLQELSFVKDGQIVDRIEFEGKTLFLQGTDILMPAYALYLCSEREAAVDEIREITTKILTNY